MPNFVITGASGAGKSSLIAALDAQGYASVPEVGRQIVAEQMTAQGRALPWQDQAAFMDLLFARSIIAFDEAAATRDRITFFDRSFLEAIAYGAVIGRAVPPTMMQAAALRRFDTPVFVCPPWRDIFAPDPERQHDFEFALRDYEANIATYTATGYDLIEIPCAPIADRVAFIEHTLASLSDLQPSNPTEKG